MTLPFEKLVGAGNDFVFALHKNIPKDLDRSTFAKQICNRNTGIGADGLVIIHELETERFAFVWDFYNSDGSKAEMCGNAARCTVLFIHEHYQTDQCEFETMAGLVKGHYTPGHIEVSWKLTSDKMAEVDLDLENFKSFKGYYINTGVPHFVIHNQLNEISLKDCAEIQAHPKFGKEQTNVTLLDSLEDGVNSTKTFERGVKDFTLACGTGVIASAFVLQSQKKEDIYHLEAPGGSLSVKIDGTKVTLIGPAQRVFKGEYDLRKDDNV